MLGNIPHNKTFQMFLDLSSWLPFKHTCSQHLWKISQDLHSVTETNSFNVFSWNPLSMWDQLRWASCTEPLLSAILFYWTSSPWTVFLGMFFKVLTIFHTNLVLQTSDVFICLISLLCSSGHRMLPLYENVL